MEPDTVEIENEVKRKVILHWSYRNIVEFPEELRRHGKHVQEIYLKWNKITALPFWIKELLNVTDLYLCYNLIRRLPMELGEMSRLTMLDLNANRLEQIPSCIGNLSNLRSLLLNDNLIEKLPSELSRLSNLETLSLSGNRIVALPEWIGSLPKLKQLYADNNRLKELPNRLTLAPELVLISVCSNRLKYLPLNGFLSAPIIQFDENKCLNYVSYPLLLQLFSQVLPKSIYISNNFIGCLVTHRNDGDDNLNANIKLRVEMKPGGDSDVIIQLPRQLFDIHEAHERATCSLWELALRRIYTERYIHTLDISAPSEDVRVSYSPLAKNIKLDFASSCMGRTLYNLLTNGPTSICVNSRCQQPIFTEAWIIVVRHAARMIMTVLCCSESCASAFAANSIVITPLRWHIIIDR